MRHAAGAGPVSGNRRDGWAGGSYIIRMTIALRGTARAAPLLAALALALLLPGCQAGPPGTPFAEAAARIPPVEAGRARIYFYRDYDLYESTAEPWIYLNGARAAVSTPGGVSYRDVAPGTERITVDSCGLYPDQFKTLELRPGETRYVKIESLDTWTEPTALAGACETFVVVPIAEAQARRELMSGPYVAAPGG